jgi:hypothetical protein
MRCVIAATYVARHPGALSVPNSLDCPYGLKLESFCEAVGGATTISLRVRPQTRRRRPAIYDDRGGAG